MTTPQDVVEQTLAASTSRACAVIVRSHSVANLRWARSTLTTNGETVALSVTVIAYVDVPDGVGVGSVTVSAPSLAELPDLVRRAEAMAVQSGAAEDARDLVSGVFGAPSSAFRFFLVFPPRRHRALRVCRAARHHRLSRHEHRRPAPLRRAGGEARAHGEEPRAESVDVGRPGRSRPC
jgi:hypothetical protein